MTYAEVGRVTISDGGVAPDSVGAQDCAASCRRPSSRPWPSGKWSLAAATS